MNSVQKYFSVLFGILALFALTLGEETVPPVPPPAGAGSTGTESTKPVEADQVVPTAETLATTSELDAPKLEEEAAHVDDKIEPQSVQPQEASKEDPEHKKGQIVGHGLTSKTQNPDGSVTTVTTFHAELPPHFFAAIWPQFEAVPPGYYSVPHPAFYEEEVTP